jgi:ribosomal protein S18 acetylase RimI-like enzyme
MTVSLRPEVPVQDEAFIKRLVTETIALELGATGWPEPLRSQLLELQYMTRRQTPCANFPEGESRVILIDESPAGWLYTADLDDHIHVAEIMMAPEHRGKGAGTLVLHQVLDTAGRAGKAVRLNVNVLNEGAIRLYRRLGFERTGGTEVHHEMEVRPYSQSQRSICG